MPHTYQLQYIYTSNILKKKYPKSNFNEQFESNFIYIVDNIYTNNNGILTITKLKLLFSMLEGVLKIKSHLLTRFDKSMMNIYMDNEFLILEVFKRNFLR